MSENVNQSPGSPNPEEDAKLPAQPEAANQPAGQVYPLSPEEYIQTQSSTVDPYGVPPVSPGLPDTPGTPGANQNWPPANYSPPPVHYPPPPPFYQPMPFVQPYQVYGPPPQAQPLPLSQAVRALPEQYRKVYLRPGVRPFDEAQVRAGWGIIWLQLLFQAILGAILAIFSTFAFFAIEDSVLSSLKVSGAANPFSSGLLLTWSVVYGIILGLGSVVSAIVSFFMISGGQYLLAKAFRGVGNFTQQAYNLVLIQVPASMINVILSVIAGILDLALLHFGMSPFSIVPLLLVSLISSAIGIYAIVLNVFSIMASHRLSGGKATGVVLIFYGIIALLLIIAYVAIVFVVVTAAMSALPSTTP